MAQNTNERSSDRSRDRGQDNGRGGQATTEERNLKEREYRDKDGNIHHHTNTYMDQHSGEDRKRDDEEE
jgi:hypothetical protein